MANFVISSAQWRIQGGGPGGPDPPPPFGPRCRLFNIGPKVGPPLLWMSKSGGVFQIFWGRMTLRGQCPRGGGVLVKNPVSVPGLPPFKNPGSAPGSARCGRKVNLESSVKPRYLNFSSGPIMTSSILSAGGSSLKVQSRRKCQQFCFDRNMFLEHQEVWVWVWVGVLRPVGI